MKLAEHVELIRQLIDKAFRNRLGRMGITDGAILPVGSIPVEYIEERKRIETIREVFIAETGSVKDAFEKLVEEFTFTLFNRMAALKVMEAHTLHPEIVTRRSQHGDRSFAHNLWLDSNPNGRGEEIEGLIRFMGDQLTSLSSDIPLFSPDHPYHLLPTAIELNGIVNSFNNVEKDEQVETDIWKSDDVLGWLYESYNNYKKAAHKESGDKTEYNKVSIQSQVYTPRWVVKFLVDNSLGKLYLEMFPDSAIKEKYKIANAPKKQTRKPKSLKEVRLIDPATGSGNFLLYAFDLFYDLYQDQIDNYGANYNENKISELIIRHNLHGVDLDDRAIQLAQLGLYIKAKRKKRSVKIEHFNVVSSDFFLPEFDKVKHLFENGEPLKPELEKIVTDLWTDLQQAYKFGALIRLEEKFSKRLDSLVEQFKKAQLQMFADETLANYEQFKDNFFNNLQKAVEHNTEKQGLTFLNTKTQDAITFLELLTRKYDVAVANPPYTDSGDFGAELKEFVEGNYKKPYKFTSNLYATFIKRCIELAFDHGYVALIHPHTFMFIKSFEDVRKFIIDNTHIEILVDYGLDRVNLFGPAILVEATWYVLNKSKTDTDGLYFSISSNQQEKNKQESLSTAYDDAINGRSNERVYYLSQSKLKIIDGWPLIYWISDGFREKFVGNPIGNVGYPTLGLKTANNNKYLRYWWEIDQSDFGHKWVMYAKGGEFNKWYGNLWLVIYWQNNGEAVRNQKHSQMIERGWDFKEGVTLSTRSVKGASARLLEKTWLFDMAASSIISKDVDNTDLLLGFANSKLFNYILDSLNPTVNIQPEDIRRVPFVVPAIEKQLLIKDLANNCVRIKKRLNTFKVVETNFEVNPLLKKDALPSLNERLQDYFNYENAQIAQVMINEAIIDEVIFDAYDLSEDDKLQLENKMGKSIGQLPILERARVDYLFTIDSEVSKNFIQNLSLLEVDDQKLQMIRQEFISLYQSNNDIEEFSIRHQINPINTWYLFKESKVIPAARASEIAMEFLVESFCDILKKDEDGLVPLVGLPNEPRLLDRLEQYCLDNGLTSAQFMQLDGLLGRPLDEYIEHNFFKNFSDHLNLFMYLPKTPFIWHLSSGEHQGFEVFIIIYKWNRDSLFKLKTQYISKRVENLEYRQIQLGNGDTAQAMNEKETIRLQLEEIKIFIQKIDELIAEGYDPKLDDGVGKNIAPLQKKGMLRTEVLNKKQLEKYLNADW